MPEVRLIGALRDKVGASKLWLPGERALEILDGLIERGGPELAAFFFVDPAADPREPNEDLRMLVNGRNFGLLDGLETALQEEDSVSVYLWGARAFPGG